MANHKYIKRQLTLNEIGIPIDKDLEKNYYEFKDLFNQITHKQIQNTYFKQTIHRWYNKNCKTMFYYNIDTKEFVVEDNLFWSPFSYKAKQYNTRKIIELLVAFFEYNLKIDILFLTHGYIYQI